MFVAHIIYRAVVGVVDIVDVGGGGGASVVTLCHLVC